VSAAVDIGHGQSFEAMTLLVGLLPLPKIVAATKLSHWQADVSLCQNKLSKSGATSDGECPSSNEDRAAMDLQFLELATINVVGNNGWVRLCLLKHAAGNNKRN
jgi:hypothetical protein